MYATSARIDAPGALHHIIVRRIERRRIFSDDKDRDNFVERLGDIVTGTQTGCFAWALIPNHAHILLRTGQTPLATVMRRLLTGYAIHYILKLLAPIPIKKSSMVGMGGSYFFPLNYPISVFPVNT